MNLSWMRINGKKESGKTVLDRKKGFHNLVKILSHPTIITFYKTSFFTSLMDNFWDEYRKMIK